MLEESRLWREESTQPWLPNIDLLCMVRDRLLRELIRTLCYGFDDAVAAAQGLYTARA
jgi:hypothetical protein